MAKSGTIIASKEITVMMDYNLLDKMKNHEATLIQMNEYR